jgi:arylsulfatase A
MQGLKVVSNSRRLSPMKTIPVLAAAFALYRAIVQQLAISVVVALLIGEAFADQPNIVIVYADDMGYGDCTANNPESKIPTPSIDRLARQGLRFTDAHSPAATCTASRYGLLTGTNPARTGVVNGLTGLGPVIDSGEVTVADFLKGQGYVTWMVGKWHLGFEMHGDGPRRTFDFSKPLVGGPLDCGFDSFFGLTKAPSGAPYFYIRGRRPVARPTETTPGTKRALKTNGKDSRTTYAGGDIAPGFVPEECNARLCDDVIKTITEHSKSAGNKPFFLYYAMLEPHVPWLPTEEFGGKSKAGPYGDYIVQLDHEIGRVLQALKDSGLEDDTLVIFSSDNGAMWRQPDIERFNHRANGIFSGTKGTPYEGGHRVPFIVRWPGKVPAYSATDALINHSDLFATLAGLFNVDIAREYPGSAQDSHSFLPVLREPASEHERPGMIVTPGSYRLGNWKLRFRRGGSSTAHAISEAMLHDLSDDPAELKDLSNAHVERKQKLFADYQQFVADRKLKPLAVQVAERKNAKKRPTKKTPKTSSSRRLANLKDAKLSKEQQTRVAALNKEYGKRRVELQRQLDDLLTNDQKEARDAAKKKALAEGKGGVKLRTAMDAALNLTPDQKKKFNELRQAIGQLTREHRQNLQEVVQDSGPNQ